MSEGDPAIGLGQAMFDVVRLQIREREAARTIRDLELLLTEHRAMFLEVTNRLKARIAVLETTESKVQAALALLEKHDCYPSCDGIVEKVKELLGPPVLKPIYTAIFLDEESREVLLKAFPPVHPKVFAHHVTLAFKPTPVLVKVFEQYLGHEVAFDVVGVTADVMGQAVKVSVPKPYGDLWPQVHHVTISCTGTPGYSNTLMALGWEKVPPIKLKGILKHFTG